MAGSAVLHITLSQEDVELERIRFEQEEVIPAHDEWMADPSSAIPIEQVRRNIAAVRQRSKVS